jgi:hypothetical protein
VPTKTEDRIPQEGDRRRYASTSPLDSNSLEQPGVRATTSGRRPPQPGVEARAAGAEHPAERLHRVVDPLRSDEPEDADRVLLFLAKKAAAFFRISRSSSSRRTWRPDDASARAPRRLGPRARRRRSPPASATALATRMRRPAAGDLPYRPSARAHELDSVTPKLRRVRLGCPRKCGNSMSSYRGHFRFFPVEVEFPLEQSDALGRNRNYAPLRKPLL